MTKLNQLNTIVLLVCAGLFIHLMIKTRNLQEQLKQRALAEPIRTPWKSAAGVESEVKLPAAIPTTPPLTHTRPWVKLPSGESYFDFSDDEWNALTNAFANKVDDDTLKFDEGKVHRVSESWLKALSNADTVRTNEVWFLAPAPATTSAPILGAPAP